MIEHVLLTEGSFGVGLEDRRGTVCFDCASKPRSITNRLPEMDNPHLPMLNAVHRASGL